MNVQLWFGFLKFGGKKHLKGWILGNIFFHWAKDSKSSKQNRDKGKIDNPWRSWKVVFMRWYDLDKGHLRIL